MSEKVAPGPVNDCSCIREAVCIHARKVFDSCRSKECVEDLRVYPTLPSQGILDQACSIQPGKGELLAAYIQVEPLGFSRGYYTVDVRYYFRLTGEAALGTGRPAEVTGLAVYQKRAVLFGGEGSAKVFTTVGSDLNEGRGGPVGVVESVDPLVLSMRLGGAGECCPCPCTPMQVPPAVLAQFPEGLAGEESCRRWYATLGLFSVIRLERDCQLLVPVFDYCLPEKECSGDCPPAPRPDPCQLFQQVQFPVEEFCPCSNPSPGGWESCGCSCCGQ